MNLLLVYVIENVKMVILIMVLLALKTFSNGIFNGPIYLIQ